MPINPELLKKARAAAAILAEREQDFQRARSEYHAIVRRTHLAGASLREIAEALDLSHQRVQQMVEGAGGSWWQRVWRSRSARTGLVCTFCKRPQDQVARLIAGPKVYICDDCISAAEKIMNGAHSAPKFLALAREGAKVRCSFCRKGSGAERPILAGLAANICRPCLDVCRQILIDSGSGS